MNPDHATTNHLDPQLVSTFSRADIFAELDLVSRTTLSKKAALRKMLRFVVEATLDGKAPALKEYTIATLVFGKPETFDPRMTSLVRTQASKLREALTKHYGSQPDSSGPWLWVPAGSYRAVFDQNPSLRSRTSTFEAKALDEPRFAPHVRVAPPTVAAGTENLKELGRAVVRLQRDNLTACNFLVSAGDQANVDLISNQGDVSLEVQQTIIELDDRLLLTMFISAGPSRIVLFGNSVSIPWSGDSGKAIAALSAPLAQFASACASLVQRRAFNPVPLVSVGRRALRWEDHPVREVPLIPQGFSSHHKPRSAV